MAKIREWLTAIGITEDQALFILLIVVGVLLLMVIIMLIRMAKVYKRYDFFMRGKDAETLEDVIAENHARMYSLQDQEMESRDRIKLLQFGVNRAFQKTGIVKYNAFEGMGGQTSFVLVMLDQEDNGLLLNAMHSRTSCNIYIKEIKKGQPDSIVSKEEKRAIEKALAQ